MGIGNLKRNLSSIRAQRLREHSKKEDGCGRRMDVEGTKNKRELKRAIKEY